MRTTPRTVMALSAVVTTLVFTVSQGALGEHKGKPHGGGGGGGGGSTATGEIYFRSAGLAGVMNADGSGKTPAVAGEPTHGVHYGFRWHLQLLPIAGEFFPNGDPREEIFAVRGDGAAAVQLTSDPTIQPLTPSELRPNLNWSVDQGVADGKISFNGLQFNADGDIIDSGIYAAQVAFDESGPLALPEVQVWYVPLRADPGNPGEFFDEPDTDGHSWSPDGTLLVYDWSSEGELYVADRTTNSSYFLASGGVGPEWSPDGTAVTYFGYGDVMTIAPDGTNWTLLAEGSVKGATHRITSDPTWSPDSSFIAYRYYVLSNAGDTMDVYIIGRDGSGKTNLTNDTQALSSPTAWR